MFIDASAFWEGFLYFGLSASVVIGIIGWLDYQRTASGGNWIGSVLTWFAYFSIPAFGVVLAVEFQLASPVFVALVVLFVLATDDDDGVEGTYPGFQIVWPFVMLVMALFGGIEAILRGSLL